MPVFHTKTIESILEPVAQQVSMLVILHEEAEDGNAMPDLAQPVRTVKIAVDNLVKVGYETINSSDDQILKQDMPPALRRVDESSLLLLEASDMLRSDPYSGPARKKLIEGSRGILQGTSSLLLTFDESEVRKIIRTCKNVLEYLAITEVVERMEDLVTFVKNLSPVITKMMKEVDARKEELTHIVHRDMLKRSLDQVKNLTPVLISGIKIFITAKANNQGFTEAQNNRDYVVRKMSDEIHEIIRVLLLTTYDEDEWDADDLTVMKKAQNAIEGKMQHAQDWLKDPKALVGSAGDKALRNILEDARKIADRCTNPGDRDTILKCVGDCESMANALSELRIQGKGNSPQAVGLARELQNKLDTLQNLTHRGIMNTERSGVRKPAPTVDGKIEQARQWLANPGINDNGLGEQATRLVVAEGRRVAQCCSGPQRQELLRSCDEVEILTNQLSEMCKKNQGNSPQAAAVARHMSDKLQHLKIKIRDALVSQVAEDFTDISTPLKQLTEAAVAPPGTPGRDANFDDRARNFQAHACKLADTATLVATAGGCRNKKTVEEIFANSKQIKDLTPQVINAARVLFCNPGNQAAQEHFDLIKKQWTDNMERLRFLVDEAVDSAALIKAEEEAINKDTDRIEEGIRSGDVPKIVNNTGDIARRANRILQVAQQEAENSEDPQFLARVNAASQNLKQSIAPMLQNAKNLAMNPRDANAAANWRKSNQALLDAVGQVRQCVTEHTKDAVENYPPPPPDLSQLHIAAPRQYSAPKQYSAPPRFYSTPPPPQQWVAPPMQPRVQSSQIYHIPAASLRQPAPISLVVDVDRNAGRTVLARVPEDYPSDDHLELIEEASLQNAQYSAPPPPPIPPPPQEEFGFHQQYGLRDSAPPRPPLPHEMAPPRPPPPDTDDEEDFPIPQANQPIMMAAHALHMEAKQWSSKDNEIITAAKKMALLMAKLSQLVRGEGGSKKELIETAKLIAMQSTEVTRLAKKLASDCTDKKMRNSLLQVCERIPTIGTQLKILSTVKATMLGAQGSEEDQEATEMLVGNAQNLMQAVKETVRAAEGASIKIRVDSGYQIRWARKRPWYT
ncbi:vinculin isoform X3 [Patella vulgata]|uniref:vinculin isoform X3 n=1 Tax=Patella vulgata TaxID=6465 RepID=UPI00217FF556|nr:vinculin isoform X3 [Patella vulgata]